MPGIFIHLYHLHSVSYLHIHQHRKRKPDDAWSVRTGLHINSISTVGKPGSRTSSTIYAEQAPAPIISLHPVYLPAASHDAQLRKPAFMNIDATWSAAGVNCLVARANTRLDAIFKRGREHRRKSFSKRSFQLVLDKKVAGCTAFALS